MAFSSVAGLQNAVNRVCAYQYSDADGDGFGWENSASCIITENNSDKHHEQVTDSLVPDPFATGT